MESLVKNNQNNAGNLLRERIVQCEAADILATKELGKIPGDKLSQMLQTTKMSWHLFSLAIKTKLFRYEANKQLQHAPTAAAAIARITAVLNIEVYTFSQDLPPFDMEKPSLSAWFGSFLMECHQAGKDLDLLDSDSFAIGFQDAMAKQSNAAEDHERIQTLKTRASETC